MTCRNMDKESGYSSVRTVISVRLTSQPFTSAAGVLAAWRPSFAKFLLVLPTSCPRKPEIEQHGLHHNLFNYLGSSRSAVVEQVFLSMA